MGIGLHGWIEVRPSRPDLGDQWVATMSVGYMLGDSSVAYDCVYGRVNITGFHPVVPPRALPTDLSEELRTDLDAFREHGWAFGETWTTWMELRGMDWEEETPKRFGWVYQYRRAADGTLVDPQWVQWNVLESQWMAYRKEAEYLPLYSTSEEDEWEQDGRVYRLHRLRRRDVLGSNWRVLFTIIGALAELYGDEGVRLVTWFSH
jgi:hypothetical protein